MITVENANEIIDFLMEKLIEYKKQTQGFGNCMMKLSYEYYDNGYESAIRDIKSNFIDNDFIRECVDGYTHKEVIGKCFYCQKRGSCQTYIKYIENLPPIDEYISNYNKMLIDYYKNKKENKDE